MKRNKLILLAGTLVLTMISFYSCQKSDDCTKKKWYQDSDGDGFGNPEISKSECDKPNGYVPDNTDFDDAHATAYPGASELCNDGIDNDGDGFLDCSDFDCKNAPGC